MMKKNIPMFLAGLFCGAALFGGSVAYAAGILATPTTDVDQRITLDGQEIELTGYLINGNNYFQLRDLGDKLGFGVSWDNDTFTAAITAPDLTEPEPSPSPEPSPEPSPSPDPSQSGVFPINTRTAPFHPAEDILEIALGAELQPFTDLMDTQIRVRQEKFRPLDPLFLYIVFDGLPRLFSKFS